MTALTRYREFARVAAAEAGMNTAEFTYATWDDFAATLGEPVLT